MPHFVVFGLGGQATAIARQIGELVHLENLKRVRMTLICDDSDEVERFRAAFPAFAPDLTSYEPKGPKGWDLPAEGDLWEGDLHATKHRRSPATDEGISFVCNADFIITNDFVCDSILDGIEFIKDSPEAFPVPVVCTDSEGQNAKIAQRLRERIGTWDRYGSAHPCHKAGIPIFVSLPEHDVLHHVIQTAQLDSADETGMPCGLFPFARTTEIVSHEAIVNSRQHRLAKMINASYTDLDIAKASDAQLDQVWLALPFWEMRASLASAGHAPMKGRMLGYDFRLFGDSVTTDDALAISDDAKQRVAYAEHNRWMAERLLAGWRFEPWPEGTDMDKNEIKKIMTRRKARHQIIPGQLLSEEEFDKDLSQQVALFQFFGVTGA